ncbi:hypothetical protein FB451DRAFT_1188370 [Mycena latifolia]|nr:hypothetical protein FB451DRAFT_1188370 [Mycena latifolia]
MTHVVSLSGRQSRRSGCDQSPVCTIGARPAVSGSVSGDTQALVLANRAPTPTPQELSERPPIEIEARRLRADLREPDLRTAKSAKAKRSYGAGMVFGILNAYGAGIMKHFKAEASQRSCGALPPS